MFRIKLSLCFTARPCLLVLMLDRMLETDSLFPSEDVILPDRNKLNNESQTRLEQHMGNVT